MVFGTFWRNCVFVAGMALVPSAVAVDGISAAAATYTGGLRPVTYLGHTFRIPRGWPVIRLADHRQTCVRFNRNALYLGTPTPESECPARVVGVDDAVLVQPASSPRVTRSAEDPAEHRITVTAPRIQVSAAYRDSPARILAILSSAGLPRPSISSPARMAARLRSAPRALPGSATSGRGFGFDTCTAPSRRVMRAWRRHSHYRAIGVYIGGSDRACAQPALSAAWLRREAAAGWHFIPLYVGPQVAFRGEVRRPVRQARTSAQDAVVHARRLGIGRRSPIYYDMEAYPPRRRKAALKFFSAWTKKLHALGYRSAIYSSSLSGIRDLGRNFRKGVYAMPNVVYDAWWNGAANTRDPRIPARAWKHHQRVHQYAGNVHQSHGGFGLNIDKDFLDIHVRHRRSKTFRATRQASQAVATSSGAIDAFYTGTGHELRVVRYRPGRGWSAPARLRKRVTSQPSAVALGRTVYVFYRMQDGHLHYLKSRANGWSRPVELRTRRKVGSGPVAVSAENGNIQVFWRGHDRHVLWQAGFTARLGWLGPHLLARGLKSAPGPSVSSSGRISVFWKGSHGLLWHTSRRQGHHWRAPTTLPVGGPGTGPRATGQSNSEIQVLWGGRARVWHASYTRAAGHWSHVSHLGGGLVGRPFAVATTAGSESAFWVGSNHRLWHATSGRGTGWSRARQLRLGRIGGDVFATGQPNGIIDVFWRGRGKQHHLMHARYRPRQHRWTGPANLGGSVG